MEGRSKGERIWDFPIAQVVKNPPAMQEAWVQSLGREYLLEKAMATHPSILAWRIPWTEGAWWTIVRGVAEWDMTEQLTTTFLSLIHFTGQQKVTQYCKAIILQF